MDDKQKIKVKAISKEEQKDHLLAFIACSFFALTLIISAMS